MADTKDIKEIAKELGVANDKLESFVSSIKKLIREEVDGFKRVNDQLSIGKDLVAELASSYKDIKDIIGDTDLSKNIAQESDLLHEIIKKKKAESDILESLGKYKSISDQIQDSISKQTDMVPDTKYYELLKEKQTIESILKAHIKSYDALLRQNRALEEQKRAFEDIKITIQNTFGFDQFKGLFGVFAKLPILKTLFENMGIKTMILLGVTTMYLKTMFGTLYKAFDDVNGAFVKTAKSFGLLKDESETLKGFIYDTTINLTKFGITAEEVAATATNIVDAFGSFTLLSKKTGEDLTLISKQLGVGNKELVDGVMTLMSFGKIDMVKATKVVYFASALSKAAGVPLAKVMDDVAKAGDKARGMIKGGAEELVKAAVYARRLGTDLEKVAEVGRKLLDFQESITDEIEASVLLGSNISLQKARELFYTGKIQEAYDEIFNVVKSIGDFNKLDIFQKEAIAKMTGMSLTDLQKQMQIREDLAEIEISGSDEAKKMVQEYRRLTGQSGAVLENTAAAREQRVKDLINLKQTEEIMARIKSLFLSISDYILPVIEGFLKGINSTLKFIEEEGNKTLIAFVTIGLALASIASIVYTIYKTFKTFKNLADGINNTIKVLTALTTAQTVAQAEQTVAVQSTAMAQIELAAAQRAAGLTGLAGLTGGLAAAEMYALGGAILAFAGALYILAKAGQEFNSVDWESMGKLGTAAVGLTALTLAIVGVSALIGASFKVLLLAAAIIGVLSLSMLALGFSMKLIGEGAKNFGDGLKSAVSALIDFGQNVSIIRTVKLAGVFAAINSSISGFDLKRLQSIVSAMQSLASALNNISTFKGFPQLTLPTNTINTINTINPINTINTPNKIFPQLSAIDTTNTPSTLNDVPSIQNIQPTVNTDTKTTNVSVEKPTAMIDAVKQGIREGMNNVSFNVYLDGLKMVTGLSKNVGFRQDTGGIAMQPSLT